MRSFIRNNTKVIVAVAVTAALLGGGPSIARIAFDARNAERVDGLSAKKFNAKAKKRKNKLIATNKKGFLPNNIIKRAPNAAKLMGIGPTGFWRKTDAVNAAKLGGLTANAFALAAHNHDATDIATGTLDSARLESGVAMDADVFSLVLQADGPTSGLNADELDGLTSVDFAVDDHTHSATDIASGTLSDARLAAAIARDDEVFGLVLGADGSGSGLDADTLDGINSGAFALDSDLNDYYTKTQSDSAFVEDSGSVFVTAAPGSWQTPMTVVPLVNTIDPTITYAASGVTFSQTAVGPRTFSLYPDVPAALYGKRMTFEGVELCYDASNGGAGGVTINSATANVVSHDGAGAASVAPFALFSAATNANCVFTDFVSPATLDVDKGVNVQVVANWTTAAAPLVLGRVTFVFSPTAQNATPPS